MKTLICLVFFSLSTFASQKPHDFNDIRSDYQKLSKDNLKILNLFYHSRDRELLRSEVIKRGATSAPVLTTVMKDSRFNERNRWAATFLLGRVIGKRSTPFISKFADHPNWIMRLASVKTLTALSVKDPVIYKNLLDDSSLIVKMQTLDAIEKLQIKSLADNVLAMLLEKKNYQRIGKNYKRSPLIKKAILVLGKLDHKKSLKVFRNLLKRDNYKDIHMVLKKAIAVPSAK